MAQIPRITNNVESTSVATNALRLLGQKKNKYFFTGVKKYLFFFSTIKKPPFGG